MAIALFNVDMWGFKSFIAEEEKSEPLDDENGRHDAPIALWHQAKTSTHRFAIQASSQSDHSVPVADVHLQPLKFSRKQQSVVCDEVSRFLELVKALLYPMLAWN
jgi:hypothetical protein